MRLILARHGNTFDPEDAVVWTGSSNDLPLVSAGQAQARALARLLHERGISLNRILTGPLLRTREFADIVAAEITSAPPVEIDLRLTEVDYGSWTGLTSEEVADRFGPAAQIGWNERSAWPSDADWGKSPVEIIAEILELVEEIQQEARPDDTILLISSNGKMRYFLELVKGAFTRHVAEQNFKVRTGAFCVLECIAGEWRILEWNVRPQSD